MFIDPVCGMTIMLHDRDFLMASERRDPAFDLPP